MKEYCTDCKHDFFRANNQITYCSAKAKKNFLGELILSKCMELRNNEGCKYYKRKWWKIWIKK